MKREELAACLWWSSYCDGGTRSFTDEKQYGGSDLDSVQQNFVEWTGGAAERNQWRRVARDLLAQAKMRKT